MSKYSLSLTPLLSVQFWQEFNLETLLPFLPAAVSILIYLVSLLTWRRCTKSDVRPQFSQIYRMISDVFSEIHNLSSAFVSPTDQPSQLSDLTTSASLSPELEPVQQPAQEVSHMSECPIYTCPFNLGGDLGCSLDKCAYFLRDSASVQMHFELESILDTLNDLIKYIEEVLNIEKH